MFRVDMTNGDAEEIVADRISFDEGRVWFWSDGVAIASHAPSDVAGVTALHEDAVELARESHARAFERWTVDEDERLRKARADGLTRVQLSELFERQPSAIRSRLDRLGLE
jgi:hypothetical protein